MSAFVFRPTRRQFLAGTMALPAFLRAAQARSAGTARYFTPGGNGRNNGEDWQNAMRLPALGKSLAIAVAGSHFALAAGNDGSGPIAIDKGQIPLKASGSAENPIILDAGGDPAAGIEPARFQSSTAWSVAAITGKKNASAYLALVDGASHIRITDFVIDGTSPDGFVKFRGGKGEATEITYIVLAGMAASNIGRVIETDRAAFLKNIVVEDCEATGIVRGFARFHNLAQATFRKLMLDAALLDGGGKNVCQLISISRGEDLLFEDVIFKNALNARFKEDSSPGYFQGDGLVCERGTKNVTIRRCHGSGMGDAAFDLKTTNVLMEDSGGENCKFGARFWTESENVMRRCAFSSPVKHGNTKGACVQASGTLVIEESHLAADGDSHALALHRLKKGAPPHIRMMGGEILLREGAKLARASDAGVLELHGVNVNGSQRDGRFELDKSELAA